MSLARLKTLYCIAVMAVGTLLAFFGGVVGWLAAVLILSSALPAWRYVTDSAFDATLDDAESVLLAERQRRANLESPE